MQKNNIISFPHMGNYYIPISYLLKKITKTKVIVPPKITKKTIELGNKYSPDYVCTPFKYNLGNYIESLEQGASIILQAGGGCRYGYYAELQEQILKNLNYNFTYINFMENNHISIKKIYKFAKKMNPKLNLLNFSYFGLNTIIMIIIMDKLDKYKRENIGFEKVKNTYKNTEKNLINELENFNKSPISLIKLYLKYKKRYKKIELIPTPTRIKIAIVGELYSIMEPYSSNDIEMKLASMGIEVHRFTTLTYLLFQKKFNIKRLLKKGKKYIKYHLGADATESVVLSYILAQKGYDGIVHIKSFGCTPEINAMSILEKISHDCNIPIIYFSFDSTDSTVAIDTRIEAFYDMIKEKNKSSLLH